MEKPATDRIRLHFEDVREVVVTPENRDLFVTTATEAAAACKSAMDAREWQERFRRLLGSANQWCEEHRGFVLSCYLVVADEGLRVFLVVSGQEFRFDLAEHVTDLDMRLHSEFPECAVDVLQIPEQPPESLAAFIPPGSWQIYGHGNSTLTKS
jgi:hypothetical protein